MLSPEQKRLRAITSPSYLEAIYDEIWQKLPPQTQVLLQDSELTLVVDDFVVLILTLQEPWIMGDSHRDGFKAFAEAISCELAVEHIGVCCGDSEWAAIKSGDDWVVLSQTEYVEEVERVWTDDRPHCEGEGCPWRDDCILYVAYQSKYLKPCSDGSPRLIRIVNPDPDECRYFEEVKGVRYAIS